jgi:hypothetical protein
VSPGLRKHRAAVYFYSSRTTNQVTTTTRTRQLSNDEDGLWWVSRGIPTGNEPTIGMKPDERLDAVIGLLAEVPVNRDSIIVIGTAQYRVLSVLPRDQGRDEHQLLCQDDTSKKYTLTEPA